MVVERDALGREVAIPRAPRRVVSLVPSETESVAAMAGLGVLVGRTEYCEEPRGAIERVPTVGGTKKLDVERVLALSPDLVLANQEENGRADVEALIARGAPVYVSFPHTAREALAHLEVTARLLHLDAASAPELSACRDAIARGETRRPRVRVAVPIWKDPWMSFDGRTFASDVLRLAGAINVFEDRARRYPLAADLGVAPAKDTERDTRYPRFALEELAARAPDLVLLPDEPYAFTDREGAELEKVLPGARIELVSGKDLFWYGTRMAGALDRLAAIVTRP